MPPSYDWETKWEPKEQLPDARAYLQLITLDNVVFLFGKYLFYLKLT